MNNITSNKKINIKDAIELETINCGKITCEKADEAIVREIEKLATMAWERNNENTAGWEYFAAIADACDINFIAD